MDVVKNELSNTLHSDGYDNLILSAPTVDITNADTTWLVQATDTDDLKKEVVESCENMMKVAEDALKENKGLKRVILMAHPPRFDTPDLDPMSIKPAMARFANKTLSQLLLSSPLKNKIVFAVHKLECSSETQKLRYTDDKSGRYDGIHMYGRAGQKAYSASVLTIITDAISSSSSVNSPPSTRLSSVTSPPRTSEQHNPHDEDHTHCPQAMYARGLRAGQREVYHKSVKDTSRFRVLSKQGNA